MRWRFPVLSLLAAIVLASTQVQAQATTELPDPCGPTSFAAVLQPDGRAIAQHKWDNCSVNFSLVGQAPVPDACRIEVSVSDGDNLTEWVATPRGNCDGVMVNVEATSRVPPALLDQWPKNERGEFDPRLNVEIAGHDSVHIEMWDIHYHNTYSFNGTCVLSPAVWAQHEDNLWWGLVYKTWYGAYRSGTCFYYDGYAYAQFHSDGFPTPLNPDVEAWAKPSGTSSGSGYIGCSYWYTWSGAQWYPNLHTHGKCYRDNRSLYDTNHG